MNQNDNFRYLNIGLPEDIAAKKTFGDFDGAIKLIELRLQRADTPAPMRACLVAEREIMRRTPEEYPFTRAEALERLRENIPDFTEEEFDRRVDMGHILWRYINGEQHFFGRFFETLCKAEPDFAERAGAELHGTESVTKEQGEGRLDRIHRIMREQGSISNRIKIRASAKVKDEFFTTGMFLRVHLPIPAECKQQSEIKIERIIPENGIIAPVDALQRTVCWEGNFNKNTEFSVEYSYIHTAEYNDISMIKADKEQPDFCTDEQLPHIVFTPYIRALVSELTAGVDDPLQKAKIFYDFITLNMRYSFMPGYFVLENIAESCARSFTGDCGVFALLFITLCRCAGIPAEWQSGLAAEPDFCGAHDWVRFYIAPYGWLYADPSYGTAAVRANNEKRRRFYFGNLDGYRMVANRAFQADFDVNKQFWRCDPYDNQVGEMETNQRGLTYDEFTRTKEVVSFEELF